MIIVYKATRYREPIAIRPELCETQTPIADNLRYDLGFHNPADLSEIVFPIFSGKHGRTSQNITAGMWHPSTKLEPIREELPGTVADWITYRHPETTDGAILTYATLEPITMREFMAAKKYKLASRHR